jgi:lipopolysaccharide biosynthesis regulator YciM
LSPGHILSIIFAFIIVFTVMAFFWSKAKRERRKISPQLYIDALKALLTGEEKVAFRKFKEVARRDPENVDAYLKLGDLFRKNKRYDKALQIHKELTLRPSLSPEEKNEILKSLAEDFSASGNHDKAISVLGELYKALEKDEWVTSRLLLEYVAYKEALNYDESCVPAYIHLGEAYYQEERLSDAVQYWKKLLEMVPDAGYLVFDKLEKSLFELGEYGDIPEIYENILSRNPKNTFALFSLAQIYEKKGMLESAIERYKQILDTDPAFLSARLSLVKLYQIMDRKEESIGLLDNLIESFPPAEKEFICQRCGHKFSEPLWRCPSCKSWNSFNILKP